MPRKAADLAGREFGRLVVLARAPASGAGVRWRCKCTCGKQCVTRADHLVQGLARSCGCLKVEAARKNAAKARAAKQGGTASHASRRLEAEFAGPPRIIETARGRIVRGSRY